MTIVGGTIPLQTGADGRVAAASLVYGPDGTRLARYDKIHLFDVDIPGRAAAASAERYRESMHVAPGSTAAVVDTAVGRLGLSVCYDVRFPELFRALSASGAQLLTIPSAFTGPTGRAHWEPLLRARAIENLCYVIAPAQSGFHPNGRETYGDSMIIDYWGRILQRLPRGRGCVLADIDLQAQAEVRSNFPALQHRAFAATHI
jgi:nitrilase